MDKRIILSVAGSGKTTYIINHLDEEKNFLIITYTNTNIKNIREKIMTKFGYFPKNIDLQTYHKFIYSFCIIPFLGYLKKINGIYFENPPEYTIRLKNDNEKRYISVNRKLYKNRMAKFVEVENIMPEIQQRLGKYYDFFCIDEIQDLSGYDFDFILDLSEASINVMMVGDYYQHTFKTSTDGNKNSSLHKDYEKYKERYRKKGIAVDEVTLDKSYRVSEEICNFIENEIGISIKSHKINNSSIRFIENQENIEKIMKNNKIIKLFYQDSSKYNCFSQNWGDSKGIDKYEDVCVILNKKTMDYYQKKKLKELASLTKNKLYVACTRARRKLYFIEEIKVKEYKKK